MNTRILVVEDSRTQAELLRHMLEQHGFSVELAADGQQAVNLIRRQPVDIVMADIVMPKMDGYTLCRAIKNEPDLRHIQVILLTSLSDPEVVIKALECGADNFIAKPWEEQFLISRIQSLTGERPPHPTDPPESHPVQVSFHGRTYSIQSDRRQAINLLLSTYEAAVSKNQKLLQAQDELRSLNNALEQKVRDRTARLEQSLKSLEGFCYTIAHDLRAPLRSMEGFSSVLLQDYAHAFDQEGKLYAERIALAASRMDQLIQDLLAFGRLSHADLPSASVPMDHLLSGVIQRFSQLIAERNAKVDVQAPLPAVRANPDVLEEVLSNLLENALIFVPQDRSPHVQISASQKDHVVRVSVQDNGIGIDPAHRQRIFGAFERLHPADRYAGTGIGLAIVSKGVERMGGQVGVDSVPGQGSKFWFELPTDHSP